MNSQVKDERLNAPKVVTIGAVAGAVSWAVVPVVSGKVEPFDSAIGLIANQIALTIPVVIVAWRYGLSTALLLALSAYVSMNIYVFAMGGSEHKAWWVLGAVVGVGLFAAPLVVTFCAVVIRKLHNKID